jgi:two-component system cell cycle response regulator DivK
MDNPTLTVLHVEDNPENRLLIRRLLESRHYCVIEAATAMQAMDYVQNHQPDLVLMDINMPDIDGYTLTSQMRNLPTCATVPIIALTANAMRGDRERTLQAGCDGYIEKPIDIDTFFDHLEEFLPR